MYDRGMRKWIYWGDDVRIEEPLIIRRDEIIFKIGFYICLIALLCLIVSFAVISYNQWWHGSVYDESLIAEIFLWIFSFSIGGVPFGLLLIWDSYRHDYKLDENGITIRYRSSVFRTVRSWGECDCLGVECLIYPKITCSRDIGGSVLEISYTPEIWDKMSVYMTRHGVKVLEPDLQQIWYKQQRKNPKSICALQDVQGELKISDQTFYGKKLNGGIKSLSAIVIALMLFGWYVILAFEYGSLLRYAWLLLIIAAIAGWIIYGEDAEWGNEWIVSRTGIQITTRRSKRVTFYEWAQINRVGVGSCGSEAAFFYIFFTANGKFKKMRVRFTEKRYKEFLAFVPEGKETDPMTSDYQIRWRSAMRSYGKSRDDFDEW